MTWNYIIRIDNKCVNVGCKRINILKNEKIKKGKYKRLMRY